MTPEGWSDASILSPRGGRGICLWFLQDSILPRYLKKSRTSLVAQWLRIRLPMQGTRVRALVWEDPTCRGPTKPVHHNYWACALESTSHNYWAPAPQLLKPACLEPVLHNEKSHRNEKPVHRNEEKPLLARTRESPRTATKTRHSHK